MEGSIDDTINKSPVTRAVSSIVALTGLTRFDAIEHRTRPLGGSAPPPGTREPSEAERFVEVNNAIGLGRELEAERAAGRRGRRGRDETVS